MVLAGYASGLNIKDLNNGSRNKYFWVEQLKFWNLLHVTYVQFCLLDKPAYSLYSVHYCLLYFYVIHFSSRIFTRYLIFKPVVECDKIRLNNIFLFDADLNIRNPV